MVPALRSMSEFLASRALPALAAAALASACVVTQTAPPPAPPSAPDDEGEIDAEGDLAEAEVVAAPPEDAEAEPAEAEPAFDGPVAPHPFTAEQIRDATRPGRTYRYAVRQGEDETMVRMVFSEVTPEQATVTQTEMSADGAVIKDTTNTSTWDQLVAHASYPADSTEITEATIAVPAGLFHCSLYTVEGEQDGVPVVTRVYFARMLPGAPVKMEIEFDGEVVFSMELLEHQAGA